MFTIPDLKSFADTYRRIGRSLFGMSSLWLAEDHLVYVKGTGFLMPFLEEYKRFRFTDIQAITLARTSRWGKGSLYALLVLACAVPLVWLFRAVGATSPVAVAAISLLGLGGLASLALLVRHLILGPTCVCDLQTNLTRERLRPFTRYHGTLEKIAMIEALIRESQAGLMERAPLAEGAAGISTRPASGFRGDAYQVPGPIALVFGVFLVLGLAGLAALHLESVVLTAGVLLMILLGSLSLTMSLVAVVRKPTPESLRAALWVTMGIHFLVVGAGAVYFLIAATDEPAYTIGLTGPLEAFTGIATTGGPVFYAIFAGLFLGFFVVGLVGLLQVAKWRRRLLVAENLAAEPLVTKKREAEEER